jgi:hypothetical protein
LASLYRASNSSPNKTPALYFFMFIELLLCFLLKKASHVRETGANIC